MKKFVMDESLVLTTDLGEVFEIDYYLTETVYDTNQVYGICIEKLAKGENNKSLIESKLVQAISDSKEIVMDMIEILVRNQVTPLALEEIVDVIITMDSMKD